MESMVFEYNKNMLLTIKRAKINGIFINAKPILILSIMDAFSLQIITENKIRISEQLINLYNSNAKIYQPETKQTPFYKPFFHLSNDGFWQFKFNDGFFVNKLSPTPSLKWQKKAIDHAYFTDSMFNLIINNSSRERLKDVVIHQFLRKNNHLPL